MDDILRYQADDNLQNTHRAKVRSETIETNPYQKALKSAQDALKSGYSLYLEKKERGETGYARSPSIMS